MLLSSVYSLSSVVLFFLYHLAVRVSHMEGSSNNSIPIPQKEELVVSIKEVVNLTPHAIVVFLGDDHRVEFPPSGKVAQIQETTEPGTVFHLLDDDGKEIRAPPIPGVTKTFSSIVNLPEEVEGVLYIVSLPLLMHCRHRKDLWSPDTGKGAVRDERGRVIGTRHLMQMRYS